MNKFCIITNDEKDINYKHTFYVKQYIESHGGTCVITTRKHHERDFSTKVSQIPVDTECAIVLGGDGTMIQAANDLIDLSIPILGVNLGTLGFLTEVEPGYVTSALDKLFLDECRIETRMMLAGRIILNEEVIHNDLALNDIVISRSGFSRLIKVNVKVNGQLINVYSGDGVLISTPTGSTGYNLSAGGPVVVPYSKIMTITPICPHSLNSRSIVVSSEDQIEIEICKSKKTQAEEAIATFDGRSGIELIKGEKIEICKASVETKLVKFDDSSFFEILRNKLGSNRL